MPPDNARLAVDDLALKTKVEEFIDWYESENHARITGAIALRMLISAGIGVMRGERVTRRMEDKQRTGKLRK